MPLLRGLTSVNLRALAWLMKIMEALTRHNVLSFPAQTVDSVTHLAEGGYEGHARPMSRTTIAGERPVSGTY